MRIILRNLIFGEIICCIIFFALCGCQDQYSDSKESTVMSQSSMIESVYIEVEDEQETNYIAPKMYAKDIALEKGYEPYRNVFFLYEEVVAMDSWNENTEVQSLYDKYEIKGLTDKNEGVVYLHLISLCAGTDISHLKYCLYDIDGDGSKELILDTYTSFNAIYSIYDGEVYVVFAGGDRTIAYIGREGYVYTEQAIGNYGNIVKYRFNGIELIPMDIIYVREGKPYEIVYYRNTSYTENPPKEDIISREEAETAIGEWRSSYVNLEWLKVQN